MRVALDDLAPRGRAFVLALLGQLQEGRRAPVRQVEALARELLPDPQEQHRAIAAFTAIVESWAGHWSARHAHEQHCGLRYLRKAFNLGHPA